MLKTELTLNHRAFPLFFVYVVEDHPLDYASYLNEIGSTLAISLKSLIDQSFEIRKKEV